MKAVVVKPYKRPYENPISVAAGDALTPDFDRRTDIAGWVWCTARDGRAGWTPRDWLTNADGTWRVMRDFDAIELSVEIDELLVLSSEESGFFWATKQNGEAGWIPCENVSVAEESGRRP